MHRNAVILSVVLGLLLLLTGCAKGVATVRVIEDEWSLKPSVISVKAGDVTFEVVNQGKEEHELVVMKTDLAANALKMRTADPEKVDEDASAQNLGEVEDLAPGTTKSVTLTLPAGRYVLICNLAGHYKNGMVAGFEVK